MAAFQALIDTTVSEFRADPRNKVYASQDLLLASVKEELDKTLSPEELQSIVSGYQSGDLDGDDEEIYDAATFCCSVLARECFADDPEDEDAEVDYDVEWIKNDDGSISAEIRPA